MITLQGNNLSFQSFYITPKTEVITDVLMNGNAQAYTFVIEGNKMKIEGVFNLNTNTNYELIVKNGSEIVYTSIVTTWSEKILKNEFLTL